ncbi:MAG: glycosyltransferase [Bradyrhizobium sp.]|jgi:glycosyltransferase involved in cell wall biosynthesis
MNRRLAILITNIWLESRGGSEIVTRDLALGLSRRGHRPIVYSPTLGLVATDIMARGIPVIDDLRLIGETPDIVHGHHSIPSGEALIRFPHIPAVYTCHAFDFWMEAPVHFPQIAVYAAPDEACRDRLVHREGIDPAQVVMLPNAVDLSRIPSRPAELPIRPLRAAAFHKAATVAEIAQACAAASIAYEPLGQPGVSSLPDPENELVQYDLVFATARAALEAMCCGCAVVVCDRRGLAGLVTTKNFDEMRIRNFGLRTLSAPITAERLIEEISRYDATDARAVSQLARNAADLEQHLDRVESLYSEVLDGPRQPVITPLGQERAVARFLHENLPRTTGDTRWPWLGVLKNLDVRREALETQLAKAAVERAEVEGHLQRLAEQLALLNRSRALRCARWLRRLTGT